MQPDWVENVLTLKPIKKMGKGEEEGNLTCDITHANNLTNVTALPLNEVIACFLAIANTKINSLKHALRNDHRLAKVLALIPLKPRPVALREII